MAKAKNLQFVVTTFRSIIKKEGGILAFVGEHPSLHDWLMPLLTQENPIWKTGTLEYPYGCGINLAMLVDALDVLLQSLQEHHHPLFAEPAEHWYRQGQILLGRREFLVMDPDGYLLRFAQSIGERSL